MALTADIAVELYHNTAYIVYLCCVAVIAPLAFLLYSYGTHLEKRKSKGMLNPSGDCTMVICAVGACC